MTKKILLYELLGSFFYMIPILGEESLLCVLLELHWLQSFS